MLSYFYQIKFLKISSVTFFDTIAVSLSREVMKSLITKKIFYWKLSCVFIPLVSLGVPG